MCGIVGLISHNQSGFFMKHQKMISQLLHAGMFRGSDATGVIGILRNGDFGIAKEASDSYTFGYLFNNSKLDKELFQSGKALIGHNRAKTIGQNIDANAHPFVEDGTFAMVHNGTLRNHRQIKDTEVDSQALTYLFKQAMDQEDWKTAMEEALGKVEGAFAVVWYDQKRGQLCMIRNKERPLSLIITKDTTLFCSEAPMGQWIAWRNNETIVKTVVLEEHTLYQFDLTKQGGDFSETNLSPKKSIGTTGTTGQAPASGRASRRRTGVMTSTDTKSKGLPASMQEWLTGAVAKPMSKNAFKKERPRLLNRWITFELDDYFPNDLHGDSTKAAVIGYSLDGAHDLVEMRHEIDGTIWFDKDLTEFDLVNAKLLQGLVHDVVYDKKGMKLVIGVDKIRIVDEKVEV